MQHELHVSFVMPDGTVTTQPSKQKVVRKPCGFQVLAGSDPLLRRIQLSLSQDALEHARLKLSLRTY